MRLRPLIILVCLSLVAWRPAVATDMAAHRALYALTLQTGRNDVSAATGTMSYEVTDACDAWAIRQRLAMTITNSDGQDIEMLSDYTTWESKDGTRMRFRMRQTTDGSVTSDLAGSAQLQRPGGPGEVHYTAPEDSTMKLPAGTLFPTTHTEAILAAAREGRKFITLPLFDGTGTDGVQDSSVAVISYDKPKDSPWPVLSKLPSARVRVAFFPHAADAQQPDYEVGMRYWENGIADDLSMDFGDFVMAAKLKELVLPRSTC